MSDAAKTGVGRFFEDFRVGLTFRHATPRTLNDGDASLYSALYGSRFAVQSAETFAKKIGYPAAPLDDLLAFAGELLTPTLVAEETLAEATTVQFPGLAGVLPGWGRMEPNDWGLGFELRDAKSPHWTGTLA